MALDAVVDEIERRDWATPVAGGPLRFAIVGLGWFGRDVGVSSTAASDHCETTVCVSGSKEKARRVADEAGAERGLSYEEFHDGAAADAYDAVYVATPNARHLEFVETAADLGKHVLCEKPLEATADRARRAVAACREEGVTLMTAYRMQTTPAVRAMRDLVADGAVGDPVRVEGCFTGRTLRGDHDQWRLDADLAGGGPLMDLGVYPLNTTRFVLGRDPVSVVANTGRVEEDPEGIEAHVSFELEFGEGVTAACHASYDEFGRNQMEVVGTEGRLLMEPIYNVAVDRELTLETDDGTAVADGLDTDEMVEEFDYFACCVLGDTELEPDGDDGLTDMRVVEAVYESAATGERVRL